MDCIAYKGGYKYQLNDDYLLTINILPDTDVDTPYITLSTAGALVVKKGYAWDGPSGPTIDTKTFMRGSLVHDALYQLMRNQKLDISSARLPADRLLQKMCKEDGMNSIRAWIVFEGLRLGGGKAASSGNVKELIHAPYSHPKT